MIYRGPGFLTVVWFGSSPTPHPSPPSLLSESLTGVIQEDRDRETTCWRERGMKGVGLEPNHTTARSLVLYKSFTTLWRPPYGHFFLSLCLGDDSLILVPGEESGQIGGSRPDLFDFMLQFSCWLPLAPLSCTFFGIPTFLSSSLAFLF
jgi:hypothetical protein